MHIWQINSRKEWKFNHRLWLTFLIVLVISGCGQKGGAQLKRNENVPNARQQEMYADTERLAEGYRSIYEKAKKNQELNTLEAKKKIIDYFKNKGYAAVDTENQIDMANGEQAERFCQKAKEKQQANLILFSVMDEGGFVRYDMETSGGEIAVEVCSLEWIENSPQAGYFQKFQAYTWKYTQNGYFFIEQYRPPGYDGAIGQTGFRIKPLDGACRELNRKYVMPVGYELNNLFIVDWNQGDYGNLEFYDLYERMHTLKYGSYVPYSGEGAGVEYEVPKEEFEEVIKTYMQVDSQDIERNAVYHPESQTYRYRPRGLYDFEFPYEPYPEVVAYEIEDDGHMKLTINAVWTLEESDCAITSELVVLPLENGGFQYVSNKVIAVDNRLQSSWYMPRLTEELWMEMYGEAR